MNNKNKSYIDGAGIERSITFNHFGEGTVVRRGTLKARMRRARHLVTEATVAYSLKGEYEGLMTAIEAVIGSEVETHLVIDFGKTRKNPKDAPNRTLAKDLARERLIGSPVSLTYRIASILVTSGKLELDLVLVEQEREAAKDAGLKRFDRMTLTVFKTSGRTRLDLYTPQDLAF